MRFNKVLIWVSTFRVNFRYLGPNSPFNNDTYTYIICDHALTLYAQMDYSFWFGKVQMYTWCGSLCILRGHGLNFEINILFLSLKIYFVLANSVDTDEMPHYAAFIWVYTACQSTYLGVYKRLNAQEQSAN